MRIRIAGLFLLTLAFTPSAYAYVDPGAGSLLLQLLLGGLAGVAVVAKLYWKKLVGFLRAGQAAGERIEAKNPPRDKTNGRL